MERLEVTTVVYASRERVFDFLLDFPGYGAYSEYLKHVEQRGDGGPGTRYDLRFAWWKLSYTARSVVTDVERPDRIDWRITKDIDATGHWFVEPVEAAVDGAGAGQTSDESGTIAEDTAPTDEARDASETWDANEAQEVSETQEVSEAREASEATRVRFVAEYDADSADVGGIDLPLFVSLPWVIEKVKPKIQSEATRIVERVVADLEGRERDVDIRVETGRANES